MVGGLFLENSEAYNCRFVQRDLVFCTKGSLFSCYKPQIARTNTKSYQFNILIF